MNSETIVIASTSPKQTIELAKKLAVFLKGGEKIALLGNLGSGKTTFAKGIALGLGIKNKITSPTFVLSRLYQFKSRPKKFLYHFDLYRLTRQNDLNELGFEEIINDRRNIVMIEWPEKAKKYLPRGSIMIKITPKKNRTNARVIKIWSKK